MTKQTTPLLILFGISVSLALIGLTTAVFGGVKDIQWLLYTGVVLAALSIVVSIYANRSLDRIIKNNYERLTKRVDSKFTEAREALDRIYAKRSAPSGDQNLKPGSSQEQ